MSKKPTDEATPAATVKVQRRSAVKPGKAKDGSIILKLVQPAGDTKAAQWLVESTVKLGQTTVMHRHCKSEEICHVVAGSGRVTLNDEWFQVRTGDTVQIPPGTPHKIHATGSIPLRMLVTSYPTCSADDIEILEVPPKQEDPMPQSILSKLDDIIAMTDTKTTAKKGPKLPKLAFTTGPELKALRRKLLLNQSDFWNRIKVTQSGGSRYESGRNVPKPVALLLNLTYGTDKQAAAVMNYLRTKSE